MKKLSIIIIFVSFLLTAFFPAYAVEDLSPPENLDIKTEKHSSQPSTQILKSLAELKQSIKERIELKRKRLDQSTSETEKENLSQELDKLDKQLSEVNKDFERIATGVDISLFSEEKEESFDWKEEVVALVKPGINELKRATLKSRQKSNLQDKIENSEKMLVQAESAVKNIKELMDDAESQGVKDSLYKLLVEWRGTKAQLANRIKVAQHKLNQMESEEKSFVESTQESIKAFFKSKGLYLFTAVIVSILIVFILRFLYAFAAKKIKGFNAETKPFHVKAFELGFRIISFCSVLISIILVFYIAQDWTLLSFTIIFLLGLGWGLKNTIPKLWMQGRLMLNIGPVREGERINYLGVPWFVRDINFYTKLENPDLGIHLRIPIAEMLEMISRPVEGKEPWFPCRKNDWVILSDGIRGKVVSLSHEMVELEMRGGAHKTYLTSDFLALSPLNLSGSFRVKVTFGLSYSLQDNITGAIPEKITEYIRLKMKEENFEEFLLLLRTEFEQAGSSSLDLVVIADFKGEAGELYSRLKRKIQSWCVEASTQNNWEIPFPQLTVHNCGSQK
jgi:small-conductance mechanosensitive channel